MTGKELIEAERQRQVLVEGWDNAHDDLHTDAALQTAGICYLMGDMFPDKPPKMWPFEEVWWKPGDPVRNRVKGGALIQAEIDRLERMKRSIIKDIDRILEFQKENDDTNS